MSSPQILFQAALQRLGARLGSGLVDAAANVSVLAQDAPEKLRQEFQLFWEEVEAEAQRLETGAEPTSGPASPASSNAASTVSSVDFVTDAQELIDGLRAKVAAMARGLDQAK
ncbi:hypothetical protein KBY58_01780 [Cyanobium sp. HWJ4-Hawea]|uniref:hypothetical protein n=1 Tax=unclassified Cyanobium TaxID=2627006 RepID=UPI0020CDFA2E|nr:MULTISPECIES: hypothetical protein [unclassified Cyanobium]MCP9775420.1 hypothetical protein [Cyanobium sp. WAJ14-Wanaka]MCP9808162.1 hypothetical protein [Cyanobium sp. HWJ4-Hawea]